MIKNDIKLRQICIIFLSLMPTNKLLMLPSILAKNSNEQLFVPLILNFLLDIFVLFLILKLADRYPEKTFFAILEENFNKPIAKLVYLFLGFFFFFKSFLPLLEQKYFVDNTLYEIFPNMLTFYPIFILSVFISLKGLKVIGRCADLTIWFTGLAMVLAIVFSVPSADYSELLPLVQKPSYNTIISSYSSIIWFSESIYMFIFLGHYKPEKNTKRKVILCYAIAAFIIVFFIMTFYAIFGSISETQLFALSNMTIFTTKIVNVGRFDYISIFFLLFSKVFAICIPIFMATKCFERALGTQNATIPAIIVNVALFIILILFGQKIFAAVDFCTKYLNGFFVFMGYIMPLIMFLILRRRKNEALPN